MCAGRNPLPFFFAALLVSMFSAPLAGGEDEGSTGGRKSVAELTRELREWRAIVDDRTLSFAERQEAATSRHGESAFLSHFVNENEMRRMKMNHERSGDFVPTGLKSVGGASLRTDTAADGSRVMEASP